MDRAARHAAPDHGPVVEWSLSCIDCPKDYFEIPDRALSLDAGGHPHLVYADDRPHIAFHNGGYFDLRLAVGTPAFPIHVPLVWSSVW